MNEPALETRIFAILSNLSAVPAADIRRADRLREDLGMDSVASMELISMLSEEFAIDVELEEAARIVDVEGLLTLAERRIGDG